MHSSQADIFRFVYLGFQKVLRRSSLQANRRSVNQRSYLQFLELFDIQ